MADPAAPAPATDGLTPLADVGAGDVVRTRRASWRVDALRREDSIALVALQPDEDFERAARTLVAPFDRITPTAIAASLAYVSRRRAMRRLAALVADASPFDVPAALAAAPARLLPFQLEPLLALRRGLAARVLIADRVGLGKTIQAALIARDLLARRRTASALILAPAGLRDQWIAELRQRAGLDAWLADADTLRSRAASLPSHVNPWRSAPIVVSSIDFVKQPDVRRGLDRLLWDLLIVDEAHTLTRGTDRLAAADALARRSDRVVLLTATPHDGRDDVFRALCELGRIAQADVLAVFRRTRHAAGPAHRRVTRRLGVRPRPAERRLHALLEAYARRVWRGSTAGERVPARLAMTVLFKRAASSAASLAYSLERRRALLARDAAGSVSAHDAAATQPLLPLDADDAADAPPDRVLAAPGLAPAHERTWLNLLVHAAHEAARDEAKLRVLRRLLRRVREPVIVFTEYRDTLARFEAVIGRETPTATIHGGCTAEARRAALRSFESGAARVLLATDAASEGLNLQAGCRFVVNVELPWSPTRLEQRVGRVDRLGQTRTVHSLHLVGGAVEAAIEARLDERRRRIHAALDAGRDEDVAVDQTAWLGAAIGAQPMPADRTGDETAGPVRPAGTTWPDLRDEARRAVAWLERMRTLVDRRPRATRRRRPRRRPFVARVPRAHARHGLPRGAIHVYRTRVAEPRGAVVERDLAVIVAPCAPANSLLRKAVDRTAAQLVDERCARLTLARAGAEALVQARRRHAVAHLRGSDARAQLSLFPELDRPREPFEDVEETSPDGTRLAGAAQLAAVLIVR